MLLKYLLPLFLLTLVLSNCQEDESSGFLTGDHASADVPFPSFNASAFIDTFQDLVKDIQEPIFQQFDNVLSLVPTDSLQETMQGIQNMASTIQEPITQAVDSIQDMFDSIQKPIDEQIDSMLVWVGINEPVIVEDKDIEVLELDDGEELLELEESKDSENSQMINEGEEVVVVVTIEQSDDEVESQVDSSPSEDLSTEEVKVVIEKAIEVPAPVWEQEEIIVTISFEDIITAMNNTWGSAEESMGDEPFYMRFFEVFMGKEVEIGGSYAVKVEEGKQKEFLDLAL